MRYLFFVAFVAWGASAAPSQLSLEWLHQEAPKTKTIEELLGRFQTESLERYVLAYASRSRQFASFESPRVIVYKDAADFIFAFNGEPGSKGFYELEVLAFDHRTARFRPEVIHFDPAGKTAAKIDSNPTQCASCHQADIRPNWDPYFHWVGFYGSEDDNFNAGTPNENDRLTTGREAEKYAQFLAKKENQIATKTGRYRFLPERHYSARPNEDFNNRVTALNMKRMLRIIADHKEAGKIWPYLDAGIPQVKQFPRELLKGAQRTYEEVLADTERVVRAARAERLQRHEKLLGEAPRGRARILASPAYAEQAVANDIRFAAGWRFVFEEIFKESFDPIPTSLSLDYRLNLVGQNSFFGYTLGTHVDRRTGRVVLPSP